MSEASPELFYAKCRAGGTAERLMRSTMRGYVYTPDEIDDVAAAVHTLSLTRGGNPTENELMELLESMVKPSADEVAASSVLILLDPAKIYALQEVALFLMAESKRS